MALAISCDFKDGWSRYMELIREQVLDAHEYGRISKVSSYLRRPHTRTYQCRCGRLIELWVVRRLRDFHTGQGCANPFRIPYVLLDGGIRFIGC